MDSEKRSLEHRRRVGLRRHHLASTHQSRPRTRVVALVVALVASLVVVGIEERASAVERIDCRRGSLQAAIDAALPGDTLLVSGTCREAVEIDKPLTVVGIGRATVAPGPGDRVDDPIGGDGSAAVMITTEDPVVVRRLVLDGSAADADLDGLARPAAGSLRANRLTVSGFSSGVKLGQYDVVAEIRRSTVTGNGFGVGLYGSAPTNSLLVVDSLVAGNEGSGLGGREYDVEMRNSVVEANGAGISLTRGALVVRDSVIQDNGFAGVGSSYSLELTMEDSLVAGNVVGLAPGAGQAVVRRSAIRDNSGVGVLLDESAVVLEDSIVENNAEGAISVVLGQIRVRRSLLAGNGFAVDNPGGIVEIENSTVTANEAGVEAVIGNGAGAILRMVSSTVFGNAGEAGAIANADGGVVLVGSSIVGGHRGVEACGGDITSRGYNLRPAAACAGFGFAVGDRLLVDDADAGLLPLGDNGGPTDTLGLMPGSIAVDWIPPGFCDTGQDQRGVRRPQGAGCDVGAFELEQPSLR